jgi:O-antigen ligase
MLLLGLLVVTARLSENRIVWGALGASVIVLVLATRGAERRRAALAAVLAAVAFGALLVDAMQDRALKVYPPNTTVEDTLERDPRLAIWRHAGEHLAQRPLTGHGYGRLILQEELRADTGDHLLTHAHNMFVSHALQTGAIGLALLLVLLVTLLARYANLLRTHDATLRRVGTLGLAVIAAFVVKNLTDDFFFRANQKVLFALNAVLLGMAVLRERELRRQD